MWQFSRDKRISRQCFDVGSILTQVLSPCTRSWQFPENHWRTVTVLEATTSLSVIRLESPTQRSIVQRLIDQPVSIYHISPRHRAPRAPAQDCDSVALSLTNSHHPPKRLKGIFRRQRYLLHHTSSPCPSFPSFYFQHCSCVHSFFFCTTSI